MKVTAKTLILSALEILLAGASLVGSINGWRVTPVLILLYMAVIYGGNYRALRGPSKRICEHGAIKQDG